jgi:NhaP-type Na+/H+ or K+/H+ antiporter
VIAAGPGFAGGEPYAAVQLFIGLVVFAAVLALSRQGNRAFSPAMVYLLLGAAAAGLARALGVDWLDPVDDSQTIERISEFAVIVALFGAGLKLDRPLRWGRWSSTARLILIVMPLTIAAVAAFGAIAMGLSFGAAIVLGAVLSPTDPVLASDVQVGPPGEGQEREPQFALTSEAGLNDGVAFPFVILGTLIAAEGGTAWFSEWLVADVIYGIGVGVGLGAVAGYMIAAGARWLRDRNWLLAEFDGWLSLAAVLAVYGATELVGAYGFLAAFASGLGFRRHAMGGESHGRVHAGADTVEKVTELTLVLLLGSLVTAAGLAAPGVAGWMLVPLLLFAIRPLATLGAFARSSVPLRERAFIGWFGIRGIGSLYYAAVVVHAGVLEEPEAVKVFWTVVVLTAVSILVHGVTAASLTRRVEAADARGGTEG